MKDYQDKYMYGKCKAKPMPNIKLAESYVADQPYVGILPLEEGFKRGSIFPNLYQPYKHKCSLHHDLRN